MRCPLTRACRIVDTEHYGSHCCNARPENSAPLSCARARYDMDNKTQIGADCVAASVAATAAEIADAGAECTRFINQRLAAAGE